MQQIITPKRDINKRSKKIENCIYGGLDQEFSDFAKEESKIENEMFDEAENIPVLPIKKTEGIIDPDEGQVKFKGESRKLEKEIKARVKILQENLN